MKIVIISFITGLLLVTSVMSFFYAQSRARDQIRIKDIQILQKFLNAYKANVGFYPSATASGQPTNWQEYLDELPVAPIADGSCAKAQNDYKYSTKNNGLSYELSFCLGHKTDGYP